MTNASAHEQLNEHALEASFAYRFAARTLDIVLGSILLVLALPVILALVILVRLDSKGPAIFRQPRTGIDAVPFTFLKFRTMYMDAKERFPHLYAYTPTQEQWATMYYKQDDDPRLTRFGRFARKTSIDELPNLINVVKGDMSLVGPRPELPQYARYYSGDQRLKFAVKPGMTGLAVVTGRNNLTVQEQIEADVEYVRRRSFLFDLQILARTVWVVIRMVGAV